VSGISNCFVLCDNNFPEEEGETFLFTGISTLLMAFNNQEADILCRKIHEFQQAGMHLAGFVSYNAAPFFNHDIIVRKQQEDAVIPLMCFGVFQHKVSLTEVQTEQFLLELECSTDGEKDFCIDGICVSENMRSYQNSLQEIHQRIYDGDTYQTNYTQRLEFDFTGNPISFYRHLRNVQPVRYGALLSFPGFTILSRSPELFIRKSGDSLVSIPMKGTISRGNSAEDDMKQVQHLKTDVKSVSENIIIVDLIRNDMGQIAITGSVMVSDMCKVEQYPTLHQMTSSISCNLKEEPCFKDIFKALFPCGSITGAPKVRTSKIIYDNETTPRGVYTGAIGFITKDNDMCFNVAIRTIELVNGRGVLGIGSGIIHASVSEQEYDECLLKAKFAISRGTNFNLIESILFVPSKGLMYLDSHMDRMRKASQMFSFKLNEEQVLHDIRASIATLKQRAKIRIELSHSGEFEIRIEHITSLSQGHLPPTVTLCDTAVHSGDLMLYFKTTKRTLYNSTLKEHRERYGSYDVLFMNEHNEITEASCHNLFIRIGTQFYTPPVYCGLLDGTARRRFMADNEVEERPLNIELVRDANEIILTNAIRGSIAVKFYEP